MSTPVIIAITGGIGAGKSMVSRVLRALGYSVYDCDSRAHSLMEINPAMRSRIASEITPHALRADGSLNRRAIAEVVFSDAEKLSQLNDIVHGAVRLDCQRWAAQTNAQIAFVETAILYESHMNQLVHDVWEVTAPTELRIQRVMQRNGISRNQVLERIAAQSSLCHPSHKIIVNDTTTPMVPQILSLLKSYGTIA